MQRAVGELKARRPPREPCGRRAILDAACELLVTSGLIALRLDAVADRTGTSVESILRWWPSEEALALDALRHEWLALASMLHSGA